MKAGGTVESGRIYIPALDGVRGLAILGVVVGHFSVQISNWFGTSWAYWLGKTGMLGRWGVDVFFTLSGFLVTDILIRTRNSPDYLSSFYGRRMLRTFPLYYMTLVFLLGFGLGSVEQEWMFWTHLSNWRKDLGLIGQLGPVRVFWSLSIEEQFYCLWPVALMLALSSGLRIERLCLIMLCCSFMLRCAAAFSGFSEQELVRLTPMALDGFALGGYLACRPDFARRMRQGRFFLLLLCGIAALIVLVDIFYGGKLVIVLSRLLASVLGAMLISCAISSPSRLKQLLEYKLLRVLGKYCYGIYILHALFVMPLLGALLEGFVPGRSQTEMMCAWPFLMAGAILLSVGLAALSWHFVEAPCLSLKRFFGYRPPSKAKTG